MVLNRYSRLDLILIFISFIGCLSTGILLIKDDLLLQKLARQQLGSVQIAQMHITKSDVRRKSNQSLTWYPSFANQDLYENDSIFTGTDSEAVLITNDQQTVKINPSSLVVLQTINNELVYNLQLGSIQFKNYKKSKIVMIDKGQLITLTPSAASADKDLTIIKDESGEIKMSSENEIEKNILTKQRPNVEASPPLESSIKEVALAPLIVTKSVKVPVKIPVKIKPFVIGLKTPTLMTPLNQAILTPLKIGQYTPIFFSWSLIENADSYDIYFSNSSDFKNITLKETVSENRYILKNNYKLKNIFWKVRARLKSERSIWTNIQNIEIQTLEETN